MKKQITAAIFGTALVLLALMVTLTGCGSTVVAAGWAGVTVSDGDLYTVSSLGQLDVLAASDLTSQWATVVEGVATSGGFLSCSAGSTAVAVYGTPAVSGDLVYIAGYNGRIYAYSISKHGLSIDVLLDSDDVDTIVGGVVAALGKVFVASSNGNLYALDENTLAQSWKFETGNKIWSTPTVSNGVVFIGSYDKKVYAVDAVTGEQKWSFSTQGAVMAAPVVDNGTVYVVSFDRNIYAIDEVTGSLKWQYPASNQSGDAPKEWFWATPVISNGVLYAPCLDGNVYAVDTADHSKVTVLDLGDSISSSPTVCDGKVIVATENAKIFALDVAASASKQLLVDLRLVESQSNLTVNSQLSTADGVVYIHSLQPEKIYALNVATGKYITFALESVSASPTATATVTVTVTAAK